MVWSRSPEINYDPIERLKEAANHIYNLLRRKMEIIPLTQKSG